MPEDSYRCRLAQANSLTEPAIRAAIRDLALPAASRGLDAACGIGSHALWLAEAVSPSGYVTGLDISGDMLKHARARADSSPFATAIEFKQGDVKDLPFDDGAFDWVWCADTLWAGGDTCTDPLPVVRELTRVVRPGGTVALAFWSGHRLLPGYPYLEARLNATGTALRPFTERMPPGFHASAALGWLDTAGLAGLRARTFVADIQGPLDDRSQASVAGMIDMLWETASADLSAEDRETFDRLRTRGSGDSIVALATYHGFIIYSIHSGTVVC